MGVWVLFTRNRDMCGQPTAHISSNRWCDVGCQDNPIIPCKRQILRTESAYAPLFRTSMESLLHVSNPDGVTAGVLGFELRVVYRENVW